MAAPASPMRRVLGDKTTNASLHVYRHDGGIKATPKKIHISPRFHDDEVIFLREENPKIGQKRSIAQVDGTEEHEESRSRQASLSRGTKAETDVVVIKEEEDSDAEEPSSAETKATHETKLTSFHESQEGPLPLEEQFEIQEEASQRTLEKLVSARALRESTLSARRSPFART
jgi:hypothetical protein